MLVERGDPGLGPWPPGGERPAPHPVNQRGQVLGGGAAAAAHQGEPELGGERLVRVSELAGGQRVVGAVGGEHRQARVGHAGDRDARMAGQIPQVLAHLPRAGGAVEPDQADAERFQGGERGTDLAAEQHRAGRLDGHVGDQRDVAGAGRRHRPPGADDRRLRLQQVLAGLDHDRVHPAAQQAGHVVLVGVAQVGEAGMAEGRQLGAGADRAEHPPGAAAGAGRVGGRAGDPGPGLGQLLGPLLDPVFPQVAEVGAERVGGDAVHPGREVGVVDGPDDVRPGEVEDLVAALMAVEVAEGDGAGLEHGAHGPVGHDDPPAQCGSQLAGRMPGRAVTCRHRAPILTAGDARPASPAALTAAGVPSD